MIVSITNKDILKINQKRLSRLVKVNYQDLLIEKNFLHQYFEYCNKIPPTKTYQAYFESLKKRFTRIENFETCSISNIVYFYTYKNRLVYAGESFKPYYLRFDKGYGDQLFGRFANKCIFSSRSPDWQFYIYDCFEHNKNLLYYEANLIDQLTKHHFILLNCQDEFLFQKINFNKN